MFSEGNDEMIDDQSPQLMTKFAAPGSLDLAMLMTLIMLDVNCDLLRLSSNVFSAEANPDALRMKFQFFQFFSSMSQLSNVDENISRVISLAGRHFYTSSCSTFLRVFAKHFLRS